MDGFRPWTESVHLEPFYQWPSFPAQMCCSRCSTERFDDRHALAAALAPVPTIPMFTRARGRCSRFIHGGGPSTPAVLDGPTRGRVPQISRHTPSREGSFATLDSPRFPSHEQPTSRTPALAGIVGGWLFLPFASPPDFGAMLDFPPWTARVFVYAGLCLLLLGLMAWLGSHRMQRRSWGRRLTFWGGGLFVVGTAWRTFLELLSYVLG